MVNDPKVCPRIEIREKNVSRIAPIVVIAVAVTLLLI